MTYWIIIVNNSGLRKVRIKPTWADVVERKGNARSEKRGLCDIFLTAHTTEFLYERLNRVSTIREFLSSSFCPVRWGVVPCLQGELLGHMRFSLHALTT